MAPSKALKYVIILVACIKTGYTIEQEETFATTSVTTEVPTTTYSTTVTEQQETTEAVTRTEGPTTVEVDDGTTIVTQGASEVTPSPPLSTFVFEVDPENEGNLQDIDAEETKMYDNLYIHFEPKKFVSQREKAEENEAAESVHITSYIADSETAKPMEMKNGVVSLKRNKSEGADMISAFFVAPDDEVNEIDKNKYSGRPIVVTDLREDLIRTERYSNKDSKPSTNNILAPIRAAVSLSQDDEKLEPPMIEKQELHEAPVYKTIIDIQKSIPYEIKEVEQRDTQQITNDISHQINYQRPLKTPLYYRYPMYYIPQGYIGNYIMRHSHENTGFRQIRPAIIPVQYYIRYPQPQMPQVQAPQAQQLVHVPQIYSGILLGNPYYLGEQSGDTSYETDQNGLQSENKLNYQSHQQQPYPSQHLQQVNHLAPFRPSHSVFSSQYPPYTYRVLSTMRGRGARSAKSKQLCIEYGGFKPPMVPSVQIDDIEKEDPAQEKSIKEETSEN